MEPIFIRVTSIGSCVRPYYYQLTKEHPLPSHFYSTKGHITHELIETELSGGTGDITHIAEEAMQEANVPDYGKEELRSYTRELHDNFHRWKETTNLVKAGEPITIEERLTRQIAPGVFLTGKPDLCTDELLVDFKSGRASKRKAYKQQLGAYNWLKGDEKKRKLVNVFLGDKEPKEIEYDWEKDINPAMIEFWDDTNRTIDEMKMAHQGIIPPARRSFICAFCEYVVQCRGYGGIDIDR